MKSDKEKKQRYQLRFAAGTYWLLDMEQEGAAYRKPFLLNETAAEIWKRYAAGETEESIAKWLQQEYAIDKQAAEEDVRDFLRQLGQSIILPKDE